MVKVKKRTQHLKNIAQLYVKSKKKKKKHQKIMIWDERMLFNLLNQSLNNYYFL